MESRKTEILRGATEKLKKYRKLTLLAILFEGISLALSIIRTLPWMFIALFWVIGLAGYENANTFDGLVMAFMPLAVIRIGQVIPSFCIIHISKKDGAKTKKMRLLCCVLGLVKLLATAVISLGIVLFPFSIAFSLSSILWGALYALCSILSLVLSLVAIFLAKNKN